MKTIHFKTRKQGKTDPVITLQVFDARFPKRRCILSLGRHVPPGDWDKRKQRTKSNPQLNTYMDSVSGAVIEFLNDRIGSSSLNREDLKKHLEAKKKNERAERQEQLSREVPFFATWERIINETKTPSGEPLSPNTIRAKKQTLRLLKDYAIEKKVELTFQNIDLNFYHSFDAFMQGKGLKGNSRGKHFKELKAVMREAAERDIPVNEAYRKKKFRVIKESVDDVYLSIEEIKKLMALKLDKTKEGIRDLFVMACFSGLRHSDWYQIRPENIVREDGREMLAIKQKKTGDRIHIPIHPVVRMILAKYDGHPRRVPSSQKFNKSIQAICKDANLGNVVLNGKSVEKWKEVSSHTARRSFATNAYLSRSLDVYQIMRCTGHKTESSFLKYLKLNGRDYARLAADAKFFNDTEWTTLKVA